MTRVFSHDLMKEGGKWLAQARDFLQRRVPGGEDLIWGSEEPVRITVRQIEEMAAEVAARAINEHLDDQKELKEILRDCPIGYNGKHLVTGRWSNEQDIIDWFSKLQAYAGYK